MDGDGKTALVTGGAAGIGAGIAERLAAEGMNVIIADLDREAGAATAGRIGGSFVQADVASTAGVRTAVDAARQSPGDLGVLVSNAGGVEEPYFPAADQAKWNYTLDLNLRAVMLAVQLVLNPMAEAGGGAIITVASVAGLGTTSHDCPEYAAAKAGLIRFTACLAPLRDTMGRAGQLHLPRPGRYPRLTPVAGADDAGSAGGLAPGAHAGGHRGRRDAVAGRRHPRRADHGVPWRRAQSPAPARRLADRVIRKLPPRSRRRR